MKILHTPNNEANNPYGLSTAEREIGFYSRLEILRSDGYFDTADRNWSRRSIVLRELMRWPLIIHALIKYDVIHYNNGSFVSPSAVPETGGFVPLKKLYNVFYGRLLEGVDIALFHFFGKKISVTFQGSDARIIEYCKENYAWHFCDEEGFVHDEAGDADRVRRIKLFDRYADNIYAVNPDLLNTLPKRSKFVPYASVFSDRIKPSYPRQNRGALKIVHAPSNRGVKGTRFFLSAIAALKDRGFDFELVLVEGLSNEEALAVYRGADLVLDQLLAGWYGAFAVEAMAMGKPVVCYIREEDLVHIPDEMAGDLPIINANPDTVLSVIEKCLGDGREGLSRLGERSRAYVEKWHDPRSIAKKIVSNY